jgi:hypothetical protein
LTHSVCRPQAEASLIYSEISMLVAGREFVK